MKMFLILTCIQSLAVFGDCLSELSGEKLKEKFKVSLTCEGAYPINELIITRVEDNYCSVSELRSMETEDYWISVGLEMERIDRVNKAKEAAYLLCLETYKQCQLPNYEQVQEHPQSAKFYNDIFANYRGESLTLVIASILNGEVCTLNNITSSTSYKPVLNLNGQQQQQRNHDTVRCQQILDYNYGREQVQQNNSCSDCTNEQWLKDNAHLFLPENIAKSKANEIRRKCFE